jgi:positive regulator of sigma E activity
MSMLKSVESRPRKLIKSKVVVFFIALVILILNWFFWFNGTLSFLEFLGILIAVGLGGNAAFSLINRRNRMKQKNG